MNRVHIFSNALFAIFHISQAICSYIVNTTLLLQSQSHYRHQTANKLVKYSHLDKYFTHKLQACVTTRATLYRQTITYSFFPRFCEVNKAQFRVNTKQQSCWPRGLRRIVYDHSNIKVVGSKFTRSINGCCVCHVFVLFCVGRAVEIF